MYKLEKIAIDEGKYSSVGIGHIERGNQLSTFLAGKHEPKPIRKVSDIEIGLQVLLMRGLTGYLNTSPVKEIIEKGENYIVFHTNTSTYRLEKMLEE